MIYGTIIGVIKGDTRSLDRSSNAFLGSIGAYWGYIRLILG